MGTGELNCNDGCKYVFYKTSDYPCVDCGVNREGKWSHYSEGKRLIPPQTVFSFTKGISKGE